MQRWESGEHLAERDKLLRALGKRAERGGDGSNQHISKPETVSGLLTTANIAAEIGKTERSVGIRQRSNFRAGAKICHGRTSYNDPRLLASVVAATELRLRVSCVMRTSGPRRSWDTKKPGRGGKSVDCTGRQRVDGCCLC